MNHYVVHLKSIYYTVLYLDKKKKDNSDSLLNITLYFRVSRLAPL